MVDRLSDREMKFALEYVNNGGNACAAARAAGYSESTVKKQSHEIVVRPQIQREIVRLRGRIERTVEKDAVDVINQFSKMAFAQVLDYFKQDESDVRRWVAKAPNELTDEQRAAVHSFVVRAVYKYNNGQKTNEIERYEYDYILHDQQNALIQMGRHFGIFDDKLKLVDGRSNRFSNLSPEQLADLRKHIVTYMERATAIDGESSEPDKKPKMLPDDSRHGRANGN